MVSVYESGTFKAYSKLKPNKIVIAGKAQKFAFEDNVITVEIAKNITKPVLNISW